jgi:HAD superfamily hydrolase (TIGR01509 family)
MKSVLFDMDGVILDSEIGAFSMMRDTLLRKGIDVSVETLLSYTGKSSITIAAELVKKYNLNQSAEEFLEEHRSYGNYYADFPDLRPMPGLLECLEKLRNNNVSMAIVSSTSSKSVLFALNRLSLIKYFDVIICGDMVKKTKPSPEGYLLASKWLESKPEECIIIEDSPIGIQAAKNAGIKVIAYKGSAHIQDTSAADIEVNTFSELLDIMDIK